MSQRQRRRSDAQVGSAFTKMFTLLRPNRKIERSSRIEVGERISNIQGRVSPQKPSESLLSD